MTYDSLSQISTWSTRQIIAATLIILFIGIGFWLLFQIGWLLFIFFIAIVIGTALKPATDWFRRRGIPQTWGIIVVYLLLLLILLTFLVLLLPPLVEQTLLLAAETPTYYNWFRNTLLNSSNLLLQQISWQLPPALFVNPPAQTTTTAESTEPIIEGFNGLSLFFKTLFMTIATLMLSFYWTLDGQRALQALYLLVPIHYRDGTRNLVKAVEAKVGMYVRSQIILCFIIGMMSLAAYIIIGLPNALALALFAGIMEIIPVVGPIIGAIPAVILATSMGFDTVVWIIAASVVIQQLENAVILPRVMDKSVGVHPIFILVTFFTLSSVLGVLGAILAAPIAAVIQLLFDRFTTQSTPTESVSPASRDEVALLRYKVQELAHDIRKQTRQVNPNPEEENYYLEDELEAIANELTGILEQSEPAKVSL